MVSNGRDAQLKLHKQRYCAVFLDLDLKHHSGIEVLRYLRASQAHTPVVLVGESTQRFTELGLEPNKLLKLGVRETLVRPLRSERILAIMNTLHQSHAWKEVAAASPGLAEGKEEALSDGRFTSIRTEEFFGGTIAVFDIWLRLGKDRYLKVFRRGEPYDPARLQRWAQQEQGQWLYFLTQDRAAFLNYLNETAGQVLGSPHYTVHQQLMAVKNVADQYVQQVHTQGFRPEMVTEGKHLCENMLTLARKDGELSKLLREFEEVDPAAFSEAFLTAFFSSMIVSHMPWGGPSTVEKTVLGALMCNLGKLRLPARLRERRESELSGEDLASFRRHPILALEMLESSPWVQEAVRQVVYQRHEKVNGTGYPNGLTGMRIFPLAKIVSFAGDFAIHLRETGAAPLDGLRTFLKGGPVLGAYDPMVIRTFLLTFVEKEKGKSV